MKIKALNQEYKFKNAEDTYKTHCSNTHVIEYESNTSDDEEKEVYAIEFVWLSKAMFLSVTQLTQMSRHDEVQFTSDVSKCDSVFDEFLKNGNITLSHAIRPLEELKRHAYCK